jgi:hypothetical protein
VFGNDTTLLYKQRLEQIKSFSSWLNSKPNGQISFTNLDTNATVWKVYDTAFVLFFDKLKMDSLFQTNQEVLAISAKYQLLKMFISAYDNLVTEVPFDSIKFKSTSLPGNNQAQPKDDNSYSKNSIILYFLIDEKEYEVFGFFFAENSAKLTGMTETGGDENNYKIVSSYIKQLSAIKKEKKF